MPEPTRRLTPAELRDDALRIIRAAQDLIEFTGLYEDVYADDLSDEVVNGFEYIAAAAKGAANRQKALHEWSSALADSVNADLERIKVAEPPVETDALPEGRDAYRDQVPPPADIDPDEETF